MDIIRKAVAKKAPDSLTYILSDGTRDRYGDIIEPAGWDLTWFRRNPIALFNHQPNAPIGKWANVRVEDDRLMADLEPAETGTSDRIDEIVSLIRQNILPAASVGFRALTKPEPLDRDKPGAGMRYSHQELLETSVVSIPANPAALQLAKSLGISDDTLSLVFGKQADIGRRDITTTTGKQAAFGSPHSKGRTVMSMPISKQIEETQERLNAARDKLNELTREPGHDEDEAKLLADEIDAGEQRLASLHRSERALSVRTGQIEAAPAAPMVNRRPLGLPVKEVAPVDMIFRMLASQLRAEVVRRPVEDMLRQHYPDDEGTAIVTSMITRAAVSGATTTGAGWAIDLVQLAQGEFVNLLYPASAFRPLSAMGSALTFGPNAGAIKIPSRTAAPSIGGSFVAEAQPIPVRRLGTTSITLYPHKVGGISVYSREIAAYSNPDIEGLIRDSIVNDTSINIDGLLLDNNAVSTTRPAGLTNGVTPLTATTGGGYSAFLKDINQLTAPFYAANAGRKLALLMNPAQRNQLVFAPGPAGAPFGWAQQFTEMFTIIASTSIPAGAVYLIDAVDFVSVSGAPEFEVSEVATLHMEDTTPLNIGTVGTPNVVAAPTQSMFQTGQIAIRMLANVSWAMRRAGMVQFIASGVNWGP